MRDTARLLGRIPFFCFPIKWLIIAFAFLFLSTTQIQASSNNKIDVLKEAEQLNLANDPTWLKLLHYERGSNKSVVLTDSFFLSPNGRTCPSCELKATINAYFAPWDDDFNKHARCRFPARYYWLSNQLSLSAYNLREIKCQRLENWTLFDTVKSVSLLLVSGYFGNPASTFGHALLKLNTDSPDDEFGLFDSTLNYGAAIPENENTLFYVARGLFGGYKAGFSDKYFYTEDIIYSRTEFRDIWDYRLALSDYERTLLVLHIWEIVGNKFKYYFLNKNCAYRLVEMLDLVIEEELLANVHLWYIPEEIFHRLKNIDKARQESGATKLIQSVRFIPSGQRKLYHQLKMLKSDELVAFNAIVREGINLMSTYLEKFTDDRRILILDGLLAYQYYRLLSEKFDSSLEQRKIKDQILLARLQLPTYLSPKLEIPELPSPADGSRPMEFGINYASEANGDSFLLLTWSPFKKEIVGQNSLEGDELVVFDLAIGLLGDEHKAFVDKLDLVRVQNLTTLSVPVTDESQWSWKLRIGVVRIEENGNNRYDGITSFGAGHAWKWNESIIGYGMIDVAAHSLSPYVRLRPHFGLNFNLGAIRTWGYFGAETVNYKAKFSDVWGGKMQYHLTDQYAVHVEVSNEQATRFSAGLNYYW